MNELRRKFTASFTASATSGAVQLYNKGSVLALIVPASFGQTSITFQWGESATGTFYPVVDETNTAIAVTVDATTAKFYDLTSIFPAAVGSLGGSGGYLKLVTGGSVTKDIDIIAA